MKKLFYLLLTIISLQVQVQGQGQAPIIIKDTAYYPQRNDAGQVIRPAAFSVVRPTNYDPSKKYPIWVNVHGIGEVSEGYLANLRNVTLGFDYSNTGLRQYAIATPDFLGARDQYEFLAVIPTYSGELSVDQINYIFQQVEKDYSVDTSRRAIIGFSLGGKAVTRYMSSSPVNASRIAVAVAVAPVNGVTNYQTVVNSGLPFIGASTAADKRVNPTYNIKVIMDNLNKLSPAVRPYYIEFTGDGHGGINELLSLSHPLVPQNIYSFLKSVTNTSRKAYPTTTTQQPPPAQPPATTLTAVAREIGITTSSTIMLDGSASTGATGHAWGVISVPAGVSLYTNLFPKGSGWHTVTAALPREGAYTFVLNAYNSTQTSRDTIVVTYQKASIPVPPVPLTYDSETGYLVFSDGSRIKATATVNFGTKKVTIKGEDGITYSL